MHPIPELLNAPTTLHGLSAFTTIRTQYGTPLLWDAHLTRLRGTCDVLGLPDPHTEAVALVTRLDPLPEGRLRVTVTPDGLLWEHRPLARLPRMTGVHVHLTGWQVHPQLAAHKTGNYLPYVLAAREAGAFGAFEALLQGERGTVADGARTSPLFELNGELTVPAGGLPGVTRAALLGAWDRPVREAPLSVPDLARVTRAWLAGSGIGVLPVTRLTGPGLDRRLEALWPPARHPALIPPWLEQE